MILSTKNKIIILSLLILSFLTITFLVANKNAFVINLDNTVKTFVENHQSPFVSNLMLSVTKTLDPYEALVIFAIFGLFLILKNKKYFYAFTIATSLGIVLTETIKYTVQRVRPNSLLLMEQGFSFPSAHATIAMVFIFSSIFLLVPLMKKGLIKNVFLLVSSIIFLLVIFSRIYLSVHFTSDVVAGMILGSISFLFAEMICCYKKENVL